MRPEHQSTFEVSLDFPCSRDDHDGVVNAQVAMMNAQQYSSTFLGTIAPEAVRALPAGHVVALGTGGGQVSILSGRVWLTSGGDPSDHVLGAGESFEVRDSGQTLVETWSRGDDPAVIAWKPRSFGQRLRDRLVHAFGRCWDLVNPSRRMGVGTVAAVAALAVASALFGPISEERARTLAARPAGAAVLHNADSGAAQPVPKGSLADGSDTGDRPSGLARQAHRRAPGAA